MQTTMPMIQGDWGLRLISPFLFFAVVIVSTSANIGERSKSIPIPINPAGYAFSIWFVIWLFQGTAVVYGVMPGDNPAKLKGIEALSVYMPLAWFTLLLWAFIEYFDMFWPVTSNMLLLVALSFSLEAYLRVTDSSYATDIYDPLAAFWHDPTEEHRRAFFSALFHWSIYYLPTALNTAWLLLANCINVSAVAIELGLVTATAPALPVALIVFADVTAHFFAQWRQDAILPLVVIWGLSAVIVNNKTTVEILTACWVSVGVVGYVVLSFLASNVARLVWPRQLNNYASSLDCKLGINGEYAPLLSMP